MFLTNSRGISLTKCLSKIFSALLDHKITNFIENKYNPSQFGIGANHRTSDCLFILKSLINKYLHKNKKKIFVCFVDLQKAFESVWRNGLMYKLLKLEMEKKHV